MFKYEFAMYENNQWITMKTWTRPFTDGTTLDETLDGGCFNLSCARRSKDIKPFTRIRIIISEKNGQEVKEVDRIYRYVSSAKKVRRTYAPSVAPLYDWTINTIELTKALERRVIGTMTSTKYLSKDYGEEMSLNAPYKNSGEPFSENYFIRKNYVKTPYLPGSTFEILPFSWHEDIPIGLYELDVKAPIIGTLSWGDIKATLTDEYGNILFEKSGYTSAVYGSVILKNKGSYNLRYEGTLYRKIITGNGASVSTEYYTQEYTIGVYENLSKVEDPTITTVCERLLSAGITRRKGIESQEYLLDPVFAEKYKNELSPEFSFTNCTLFEALMQVGGYIHAIPRLIPRWERDHTLSEIDYYVTFDKLGGSEEAPKMPPMIYQDHTVSSNSWCGTLDSPAQNLCNTEDIIGGAVTELGNDYITVRSEDGEVVIDADNVIIRTSRPIQQVVKLECGFIPQYENGQEPVGDITSYVYESAEYSTLSSYWGTAYPYSKGYALCYSQGDNKITGLSFVLKDSTTVGTAFNDYAIVNIINAKTGLALKDVNGEFMRQLAFKVTYVPIVTTRVQTRKPCMDDGGDVNNALIYNQGANVAETSFYGEKMRGAIARLGQEVEQRTYDLFKYSQMPKCGQLLDGKYIAQIDAEYDITKIRVTLTLTKNFNMLSQYVGLDSNYRLYDISEKQSVDRDIIYGESILVGDRTNVSMHDLCMTKDVNQMIKETLILFKSQTFMKAAVAELRPYDKYGNPLSPNRNVILPAVVFPFGTSLCFAVSYNDNYGAGYQSTDVYDGNNRAVQRLVPYTDAYGEIALLDVAFGQKGWDNPSIDDQKDGGKAMLYPEDPNYLSPSQMLVSTGQNPFIIEKDSRERLSIMYQLHFVATRSSIVIGSGMANFNRYVNGSLGDRDKAIFTYIVWLDHTINSLNRYIDVQGQTLELISSSENPFAEEDGFLCWQSRPNPSDHSVKAYAVCRTKGGAADKYELLFGENFEDGLEPNQTTPPVYFSPATNRAYGTSSLLWFVNKGSSVYPTTSLSDKAGYLRYTRTVPQEDIYRDYVVINTAQINRYGCWYTESVENNNQVIELKYAYMASIQVRDVNGALLNEGTDWVAIDNQHIQIIKGGATTKSVTIRYIVGATNAYDELETGYVSPNQLQHAFE